MLEIAKHAVPDVVVWACPRTAWCVPNSEFSLEYTERANCRLQPKESEGMPVDRGQDAFERRRRFASSAEVLPANSFSAGQLLSKRNEIGALGNASLAWDAWNAWIRRKNSSSGHSPFTAPSNPPSVCPTGDPNTVMQPCSAKVSDGCLSDKEHGRTFLALK